MIDSPESAAALTAELHRSWQHDGADEVADRLSDLDHDSLVYLTMMLLGGIVAQP